MITVLFVNATIGFSKNLFLVIIIIIIIIIINSGASVIRMNKKSEAYKNIGEEDYSVHVNEGSIRESLKEVPSLIKGLFTNPTFIFIILSTACDTIIVGGFSAFGPKYVEYQFSVPASTAGILFGNV